MSFINFNNKSKLYEGKYSARVIAEALYSIETKNTKKIEATLSSVKEPVAISEALKFFSNKINALSALHVAKTNALPVNEGQFSWMTQDTGEQIGSEKENRITVYMYDNEGNQYKEDKYDGYGEFGGMDYYELLAKMNGYSEEDLEEVKGPFKEMRQLGIDLAFGKLKTKDKGRKVLFPVLVEDPKFLWKRHNFTQEPESDPNQSWYVEPDYDNEYDGEYYEAKTNEAKIVISKADMAKLHKEGKVEINGNIIEFVEEGLSWDSLIEKINEEGLNERSINKIQKDWTKVTADMKDAVTTWKSAEGAEKEKMLAKLKELTAKKKSLEAELDSAVGLKDADVELVGEAAIKTVHNMLFKNKGFKDIVKRERAAAIRKAIEAEGISTKGVSDDELIQIAKDLMNESVSLSEARDPKSIQKEYADLKKLSKKELQAMWSRSYKVGNPKELDKEGLISDILRSKHGNTYVDAAFESVSLTEAKTLKRDDIIAWIENYIEVVRTSEEFDGAHGGIWVSGENGDLYKQMHIYDYYNEGSRNYSLGVLIAWEKELNKRGWYSEWYDAGTVMIWPN